MSSSASDVVVVGLGAMGSAIAYHLARRGVGVIGIDRWSPPHSHGSSHGESRIIRRAYFEHPSYVPLVNRAYELWEELERAESSPLLTPTGALMLGSSSSQVVAGAARSAETHGIEHERLAAPELRRRFPQFASGESTIGLYEPGAAVLNAEGCVTAHLEGAKRSGAELRLDERVSSWRETEGGMEVQTDRATYVADRIVLSAGPWLPELLPDAEVQVERQVMLWFEPLESQRFSRQHCPVFIWEIEPETYFYGVPDLGQGIKVARHHGGEIGSVAELNAEVTLEDVDQVRGFLRTHIPEADGELLRGAVCRYTNRPDGYFLIGHHPELPRVLVASPCSGHGFKFASVVGEAVADLLTHGSTPHDLSPFGFTAG